MRFDVITLMPELFGPALSTGVTRRAFESRQVDVRLWPLRDFGEGPYRRVDDRPFGGGPGMVLLADPLQRCLDAVRAQQGEEQPQEAPTPLIHFTPTGQPLNQALVQKIAAGPGAVLLCGRYEGIDQRFLNRNPALEISLGDFVLSGGEIAALALLDAVARLQPGVLQDPASHEQDSFSGDGLLDCPHFSRPERWPEQAPLEIPAVLLSGNHAEIARFRRQQSLAMTAARRPDLLARAREQGRLSPEDERYLASIGYTGGL